MCGLIHNIHSLFLATRKLKYRKYRESLLQYLVNYVSTQCVLCVCVCMCVCVCVHTHFEAIYNAVIQLKPYILYSLGVNYR